VVLSPDRFVEVVLIQRAILGWLRVFSLVNPNNMWPPSDPYALPSKNDTQKIEADILRLEAELLQARGRVATLEATYSLGKPGSLRYADCPMILTLSLSSLSMTRLEGSGEL